MNRLCSVLALTLALRTLRAGRGADRRQALARQGAGRNQGHRRRRSISTKKNQNRREAAHERERADHHHLLAAEGQEQRHRGHRRAGRRVLILAIEHEGTHVCEWLNSLGVTAVLLKYRVPKREMQIARQPRDDPGRAARGQPRAEHAERTRHRPEASRDARFLGRRPPHRVYCLAEKRMYDGVDKADESFDCTSRTSRVLVYPAYLVDKGGGLKPEFEVKKDSPPMFFAHSSDDPVTSENSVALYLALKKNNVPAELHLYASGGHGYGMRKTEHPCAKWPDRAADWMKARGLLEKK